MTVRQAAFGETYALAFLQSVAFLLSDRTQKYDRENREERWRQIKSIYRWHLDLVAERLRCINCLNTWAANCATF